MKIFVGDKLAVYTEYIKSPILVLNPEFIQFSLLPYSIFNQDIKTGKEFRCLRDAVDRWLPTRVPQEGSLTALKLMEHFGLKSYNTLEIIEITNGVTEHDNISIIIEEKDKECLIK